MLRLNESKKESSAEREMKLKLESKEQAVEKRAPGGRWQFHVDVEEKILVLGKKKCLGRTKCRSKVLMRASNPRQPALRTDGLRTDDIRSDC